VNDCTNPAAAGSVVTIFLNGWGAVTPSQNTGAVASAQVFALTPAVDVDAGGGAIAVATTTAPGEISGVAQAQLQLPQTVGNTVVLRLTSAGIPLRQQAVLIWTRAN
jgi:uncharacterized protein (TIGR03437 family)